MDHENTFLIGNEIITVSSFYYKLKFLKISHIEKDHERISIKFEINLEN